MVYLLVHGIFLLLYMASLRVPYCGCYRSKCLVFRQLNPKIILKDGILFATNFDKNVLLILDKGGSTETVGLYR